MLSLQDLNALLAALQAEMLGMAGLVPVIAGMQHLDPAILQALVDSGRIEPELAAAIHAGHAPRLVEDAFTAGLLFHRLLEGGQDPSRWSGQQWEAELQRRPLALTSAETEALAWAQFRAGEHCQGLANTLAAKTRALVVETLSEDRQTVLVGSEPRRGAMLDAIRQATAEHIEGRTTRRKLRSRLLELTQDGARDWQRIAETESQRAHDMGVAMDVATRHGAEAQVYKRPAPNACPKCVKAYTVDGSVPRLFALSELAANGTNQGRKAAEWVPTLGPMHPWCACALRHMPPNMAFDASGQLVRAGTA